MWGNLQVLLLKGLLLLYNLTVPVYNPVNLSLLSPQLQDETPEWGEPWSEHTDPLLICLVSGVLPGSDSFRQRC